MIRSNKNNNYKNKEYDDLNETTSSSKYVFFDKTADVKFKAFGVTLEEAFKNALEAMISVMFKIDELEDYTIHREDREIIVEATNLESLLYNFLEEAIFLLGAESFVGLAKKIIIERIDDKYVLRAKLNGTQSINLESNNEVKAVTYNEMYVKYDAEKEQYELQVVVDI